MRTLILLLGAATLGGGCATSTKIAYSAGKYEQKAERLEAEGRYDEAAQMRVAAQKQYDKALRRKAEEDAYDASFRVY